MGIEFITIATCQEVKTTISTSSHDLKYIVFMGKPLRNQKYLTSIILFQASLKITMLKCNNLLSNTYTKFSPFNNQNMIIKP